jgi:nicotinate-nucleotide adenylyltransferase
LADLRVGILGGSFNPLHRGHIELALAALRECRLDRVLLVPAKEPPHKALANYASDRARFNDCLKAQTEYPGKLFACGIELERGGISYTFDTVCSLQALYPAAKLFLICGADMFLTMHTWHKAKALLASVCVVTAPRNGIDEAQLKAYTNVHISLFKETPFFLKTAIPNISSTQIRSEAGKQL